jgi:hypothetical protein
MDQVHSLENQEKGQISIDLLILPIDGKEMHRIDK